MHRITVHRQDQELTGKTLSANTIASLLISQSVSSVADLKIGRAMPYELLLFLNRETAIGYWIQSGWLYREGNNLYLTVGGLDEVELREAGEAVGKSGKKKPGNVSPQLILGALSFIKNGYTESSVRVISRLFEL